MEWWAEICPPVGPGVKFGGPTGIYTLTVLMSWWCALLKDKPERERTDCLRILEGVDRVLSTAINDMKNHPTTSTSTLTSSTATILPSRPPKRGNSEDTSQRKRVRSGGV